MEHLTLKVEHYEGPLDLLLALISKNKIDILDIPIAEIAEQYMAYIDSMRALNMEITSSFIHMAAELMLIKSRLLLPKAENAEDPRKALADALLEYQRAKELAAFLKEQGEIYYNRFPKPPDEGDGVYTRGHAICLLSEAFERIKLRRSVPPEDKTELFEKLESERFYTVEEKIVFILRFLYRKERRDEEAEFLELFENAESRGEIIAIFLALLELVRAGRISIRKKRQDIYLMLSKSRLNV